jgi:integrase
MITTRKVADDSPRYDVRVRAPDGRVRTKTFRRKADAIRYERELSMAKDRGEWDDPRAGRVAFGEWAEAWLASKRHRRTRTIDHYAMVLERHVKPRWKGRSLSSIKPLDVRELVDEWSAIYRPMTVGSYYRPLKQLFQDALDSDLITKSPCRGVELPTQKAAVKRVASIDDIHRLASAIEKPYGLLVYMLGIMGLRWGEAVALRVSDIDFTTRTLSVSRSLTETSKGRLSFGEPKTDAGRRTMAVPAQVAKAVEHHADLIGLDGEDLLFTDGDGKPLRRSNFSRRVWQPAIVGAGLDGLTPHGLRHSAATHMIALGINPKTTQARLGHADPRLTMGLYAHADRSADERAAEALNAALLNARE